MPSPRKGISQYRRKGPEEALHLTQLAIRDVATFWRKHVRDETHVPTFRRARNRALEVLDLEIRQLRLARDLMASQVHAVDYDLRLGRYVKLTDERKQARAERFESVRLDWQESRGRRAAEQKLREQIPQPSVVVMERLTEKVRARKTSIQKV